MTAAEVKKKAAEEKKEPKPAQPEPEPQMFKGSTSPHVKDPMTVQRIMYLVIIALLFPAAGAVYYFGAYAVFMMLTAVLTAILCEYIAKMLRKREFVLDGSQIITGLLLAMVLPPTLPLWAVAIGAAVAILIAKEAFGGLGHNIFNPALVGRAFLVVSFAGLMNKWSNTIPGVDGWTGATPLGEGFVGTIDNDLYREALFGNIGGSLGETSALLILIGGLFLVAFKVINWRIPLFYIGTFFLLTVILGDWGIGSLETGDPIFHLLTGGLMLGAFFMATDYVTAPLTNKGKIIFSVGAGCLVFAIRFYGGMPEGVAFSILIMNGFTPLIDRYTVPTPYGYIRPEKKKKGEEEEEAAPKEPAPKEEKKEAQKKETPPKKEEAAPKEKDGGEDKPKEDEKGGGDE